MGASNGLNMSLIAFENFLWSRYVTWTASAEVNSCPAINLANNDPYSFWQINALEANLRLNLSGTGNRKPFWLGLYNTNLTPTAQIFMEAGSVSGTYPVSQSYTMPEDFNDTKIVKRAFNKASFIFGNIYDLADADKGHIQIRFNDPDNPAGFLRFGIIFVAGILDFHAERFEIDMDSRVEVFNDKSTKIWSIGHQLHKQKRKRGKILRAKVSHGGLYTRMTVRKMIRRLGSHNLCFIQLGNSEYGSVEKEFATQLYYGYFSKLPEMEEDEYRDAQLPLVVELDEFGNEVPYDANGNLLGLGANSLTDYDFEFTEVV